jgi:uncharacterized protein GlcG (DUF336 family)
MAVAVVDAGGHLLAFQRHESAPFLYERMAIAKAWTTIAAQRSSRLQYERLSSRPGLLPALSDLSDGRFLAVPGGILLRTEEGHVVGAAGVAGRSGGEEGEALLLEAAAAVGLIGDAGEA